MFIHQTDGNVVLYRRTTDGWTPLWPDPTLPKTATIGLNAGVCVPASGLPTLDVVLGLPGPFVAYVPAEATWDAGSEGEWDVRPLGRSAVHVACRLPGGKGRRGSVCEAFGLARIVLGIPEPAGPPPELVTRVVRRKVGRRLRHRFPFPSTRGRVGSSR